MKKKKINSNNLLLLITIVLFFVMYAAGCIVYADKGFTRFQTFLNILINNVRSDLHYTGYDMRYCLLAVLIFP